MIGRSERSVPDAEPVERLKSFDDFDVRLGDVMRGERATLGKSLLDVQRDLKIKATYIAAIENADPAAFETPGFVAGYVRSYARYLSLDPEWAFRAFCEEGGFEVPNGLSKTASKSTDRPTFTSSRDPIAEPHVAFLPKTESAFTGIEPRAILSVAVLVALIGTIGYGGWSVLKEVQRVEFTPVDQAPGVASDVAGFSPGFDLAETPVVGGPEDAQARPSVEALDRLYRPEALDVPVLVARDGPIGIIDPSEAGALANLVVDDPEPVLSETTPPDALAAAAPGAEGENPVQVVAEGPPDVQLLAVRPSWVRVQASDGTIIFEKILDAGERYTLPKTEEPPVLRAGNAGSVYFAVGNDTFGPAGEGPSVVKNVSLAADALRDSYAIADLSTDADLARFVAVAEVTAD
ncbi:MAG: helix-turn-helix domain-containing protein [Pseudomonadota bacterium]